MLLNSKISGQYEVRRSAQVRFTVSKAAPGRVFLRVLRLSAVSILPTIPGALSFMHLFPTIFKT